MLTLLNNNQVAYAVMSVSSRGDFEGYPDLAVLELNINQQALINNRLNLYRQHNIESNNLLCEISYYDSCVVFLSDLHCFGSKYDTLSDCLESKYDGCALLRNLPLWLKTAIDSPEHRSRTNVPRMTILGNNIYWKAEHKGCGSTFETKPMDISYFNNIEDPEPKIAPTTGLVRKKTRLTTQDIKEYVASEGTFCPYCKEGMNMEGGPVEIDAGGAVQKVVCLDCDNGWEDVYALCGPRETD